MVRYSGATPWTVVDQFPVLEITCTEPETTGLTPVRPETVFVMA
jgi:hypothetical protein